MWVPPPGRARGGADAPAAASLVDAVSPDLFLPGVLTHLSVALEHVVLGAHGQMDR